MKLSDIPVNYERQSQYVKPTEKNPGAANTQLDLKDAQRATKQDVVVNISSESKDLNVAREAVNALPEVRTEKIEAVKKAITEQRYQVDADKIAERIMQFKPDDII